MATAYTEEADVELLIAGDGNRLTKLLDRDRDGDADAGVLDMAIAEAGTLIDARLAQLYVVPFAAIGDTPATPDLVQMIARHLTAWSLYRHVQPDGKDATTHFELADGLLTQILAGDFEIPGAEQVPADEGRRPMKYDAATPVLAGRCASTGVRRMSGM